MAKYQLKEPTVDAFKITGEEYTLDDGSTKAAPDVSAVGSYYVTQPDGMSSVITAAADFEAKYEPVPLS